MADVYTRIGYIKGATGAQGAQGAKGDQGDAATIQVGTVTTVAYGQTANVVNSGTSGAAVFDFTIPQGKPGEQTTDMQNLTLGSITASSASFPIPAVGETGKVLWGKVVKWFSDMSALVATKLNIANVINNTTTTESGYALDARQGKALNDKITTLFSRLLNPGSATSLQPNNFTGIYLFKFDPSTPGNPGSYYGTCLLAGYSDGVNIWLSSILFTTNGLILYSHKTNATAWTTWTRVTMTSL